VVYVLTTLMPELMEDDIVEAIRRRAKWENDDYICRGHILNGMSDSLFDIYQNVKSAKELWDSLESKYMAEDASRSLDNTQHGLKMDESISISSVIDKLPLLGPFFESENKDVKMKISNGGLWKRSMLVVPVMIVTDEEGDAEKSTIFQIRKFKDLILMDFQDEIIESAIRCGTDKDTWTDLVHSFEGPFDTKENKIMDLKLEYQMFRAKPYETLSQTYTHYKTLLNELANDGVNLSKHEINVGFMNSLPKISKKIMMMRQMKDPVKSTLGI
ncbi:hypothetical protein Tco_0593945, partial [Tanacetum coccineum]